MPKFYGVTLYAEVKLVVKADDSDEACDIAQSKIIFGDCYFTESFSAPISKEQLETAKRKANLVIED